MYLDRSVNRFAELVYNVGEILVGRVFTILISFLNLKLKVIRRKFRYKFNSAIFITIY